MDVIKVVCAVIWKNEKVLAARRPSCKQEGGLWEFPGGKLEEKESAQSALKRELMEELGIEVKLVKPLGPVFLSYPKSRFIVLLPFVCVWTGGELQVLEHEELQWSTRSDLFGLNWAFGDRAIAKEVIHDWNRLAQNLLNYMG